MSVYWNGKNQASYLYANRGLTDSLGSRTW